jgi:hypothetical protein
VAAKAFGGTYVRSVATTDADSRGLVFLYTFDPAADQYRMWLYDPNGSEVEWTGSYDEKTKTLKWIASLSDEVKGTMNWKFAETGGYLWDLAITTGGKPTLEISGDRTKKK